MQVATTTKRDDLRAEVLQLLDGLRPDFRLQYPEVGAWLENQEQSDAFVLRAQTGQASTAELIEGVKQFPKAAPAVANALANWAGDGDVQAILRALREALNELQATPDSTGPDQGAAYRMRETLANAIQRIAPDQPKPFFTQTDTRSIMGIVHDPALRADPDRNRRISDAIRPVLADAPGSGNEMTPDQLRRLLNALEGVDRPAYEAVAAQVKKIDPKFSAKSTP
jgi:hypothetical protein